ncbi:FHA domain-containing protein [bacterium]|nr:FHA domain-containing protein [bacterium]
MRNRRHYCSWIFFACVICTLSHNPGHFAQASETPLLLDIGRLDRSSTGGLELEVLLHMHPDLAGHVLTQDMINLEIDKVPQHISRIIPVKTSRPLEIALAIDTSGSMRRRLERAKEATDRFLAQLPARTSFSLYSFNDNPECVLAFDRDQQAVRSALASLRPGGRFTVLYDTIIRILADFPQGTDTARMIILITDGRDENSQATRAMCQEQLQERAIPLFAIGMGNRVDETVLRSFSKISAGEYYAHTDGSVLSLSNFFDELIARFIPKQQAYRLQIGPPTGLGRGEAHALTVTVTLGSNRLQQTKPVLLPLNAGQTKPVPSRAQPSDLDWPCTKPTTNTLIFLTGLFVVCALFLLLLFLRKKKKQPRICPKCGEEIPDYLEACINCSDTSQYETQARHDEPESSEVFERQLSETEPALRLFDERLDSTLILEDTPYLVQMSGNEIVQTINLSEKTEVTIGRKKTCDLVIIDRSISSLHARIIKSGCDYFLEDLGSTNGTFVNEMRIGREQVKLCFGDRIRMGQTRLIFKMDQRQPS